MDMNNFFCYMYTKFTYFVNYLLEVFGFGTEQLKDEFQEGVLTVVGSDCVELPLNGMPKDFAVSFIDETENASCDPHQDTLDFKIKTDCDCKYYLKIKWNVSNVRNVFWHVEY